MKKMQGHPLSIVYNDFLAFYFVCLEQLVMAALLAHVCQPSEATHNTKCMKLCQVILHSAPRNITDSFKAKIQGSRYTVVPLLKDTIAKGHLSIKDSIIWQQVLCMPLMLPLTKEHLSNESIIIWLKGCPYYRGTTVYCNYSQL